MGEHASPERSGQKLGRRSLVAMALALASPVAASQVLSGIRSVTGLQAAGGSTAVAGSTPLLATPGADATLEAFDYGYRPRRLRVAQGETVAMFSSGRLPHDVTIQGHVDQRVDLPTSGRTVYWTVPDSLEPGTYAFYCSVGPHRAMGMEGRLVVTGSSDPERRRS